MPQNQKFGAPYVVVFIPAYNEEGSIGRVIEVIKKNYQGGIPRDYVLDVIVTDDGSKDKTSEIAKSLGVRKVVRHPVNKGLGASTRTSMQTAFEMGADIAVKIDADFQHDPEDIDKVIRPILDDQADAVFGNRFAGGLQYKMPLHRAWGNRFFSWLTGQLTGLEVNDGQTGLMAFNRRYLSVFTILRDYNETQQLIIDSWGKGMRVIEVPVLFHKRTSGKSFISWKYPFRVIPSIVRTYINVKPFRTFVYLGLFVFLLGLAIGIRWVIGYNTGFFGDEAATILLISGVQIVMFGFVADIIVHKRNN